MTGKLNNREGLSRVERDMPFTLSPPSLPGLQPQRTKDPLGEDWGCYKPGRDLRSLTRERGPRKKPEKDPGLAIGGHLTPGDT